MKTHAYRWYLAVAVALVGGLIAVFAAVSAADGAATPKPFSVFDAQAKNLLAQMTLDEKVGQMTQAECSAMKDPADIATLFLGSVLSGGNGDPKEGNSLKAWTDMYDSMQQQALKTRLGIPILYGVDAVHGHNNVLGAVVFPHNVGLGATRNAALVEKIGRITAEEMRATGVQWTFAPCVTVPQDIRWGRTYEGFAEDPTLAGQLGEAATRGLQSANLASPLSVLACVKHYAGDGGTSYTIGRGGRGGLDQGDTKVDEATLRRLHLASYLPSIRAGAGTIMPSYSSWNGVKLSASKQLMTDILKDEFGFQGFLISDYNALDQIKPGDYKTSIEISINAGMDMVMVPNNYRTFISHLKALVAENRVPMSRIDDAVTRILRVKYAMGLMEKNRSQLTDRKVQTTFGSAAHRQVARQAVRESLVLLKNERKTLPVSKQVARIHVAGKSADNIGNQCGGWTIDWQGKTGEVTTGGTTVLSAIKGVVSRSTKVTYSADGSGAEGATLAVAVIGELPYAEGVGDRSSLALDKADLQTIANLKKAGVPVAVVLFSGRPMVLGDVLGQSDAIVAAWLPGTEGQGVTDILFGDFKPTGKLSYSWPRSDAQLPMNKNLPTASYDPLFKYGYGLSW